MKPVGKPDAGNRHVRFDERGWETGGAIKRQYPRPSSTLPPAPHHMTGRMSIPRFAALRCKPIISRFIDPETQNFTLIIFIAFWS